MRKSKEVSSLTLFIKKMQSAGINIQAIKKPTDVGASIGEK